MAQRYPRGTWRPLGKQTQPRMKAHDIVCAHTMVGYLSSTDDYFRGEGFTGTESHYGVGGIWGGDKSRGYDGHAFQWQDRSHTADANYEGSDRIISIETADNNPKFARDLAPWTPAQVARLVDITAWECSLAAHSDCPSTWTCRRGVVWNGIRVAIPPVLVPDSKPSRRGLAVHRQGIEHSQGIGKVPGWLVTGGERWSKARGKECPGDRRVDQWSRVVIPAVQKKLKPPIIKPPAPPTKAPPPPTLPVPPSLILENAMIYRVTLSDDPAQFIVGLNRPGEVQHLRTSSEAAAFSAIFPTVRMTKDAFIHYYFVPLWENEGGLPPTLD